MGDLQVFLHATLIAFEPRGASLGYRVPDCFGMRVTSSGHALPATGMLFPKMDMGQSRHAMQAARQKPLSHKNGHGADDIWLREPFSCARSVMQHPCLPSCRSDSSNPLTDA
jgi:hypothetical protein